MSSGMAGMILWKSLDEPLEWLDDPLEWLDDPLEWLDDPLE